VRWLLLVPIALLASGAVQLILGVFARGIREAAGPLISTSIGFWAIAVPVYVLPEFVFVVTGGWIAPRKQSPVALVLMLVGGVLSLLKHVVLQHLAGTRLGPTNFAHFGLEMAGLLAGVVCIRRLRIVPRRVEQ